MRQRPSTQLWSLLCRPQKSGTKKEIKSTHASESICQNSVRNCLQIQVYASGSLNKSLSKSSCATSAECFTVTVSSVHHFLDFSGLSGRFIWIRAECSSSCILLMHCRNPLNVCPSVCLCMCTHFWELCIEEKGHSVVERNGEGQVLCNGSAGKWCNLLQMCGHRPSCWPTLCRILKLTQFSFWSFCRYSNHFCRSSRNFRYLLRISSWGPQRSHKWQKAFMTDSPTMPHQPLFRRGKIPWSMLLWTRPSGRRLKTHTSFSPLAVKQWGTSISNTVQKHPDLNLKEPSWSGDWSRSSLPTSCDLSNFVRMVKNSGKSLAEEL